MNTSRTEKAGGKNGCEKNALKGQLPKCRKTRTTKQRKHGRTPKKQLNVFSRKFREKKKTRMKCFSCFDKERAEKTRKKETKKSADFEGSGCRESNSQTINAKYVPLTLFCGSGSMVEAIQRPKAEPPQKHSELRFHRKRVMVRKGSAKMRPISPQFVHSKKASFETKDGRGSGLSETPISVVFSVWELKTNIEREKKRITKMRNFDFAKF